MDLILRDIIYSNCSDALVEAIVKGNSPLWLASNLEEIEIRNKCILQSLLELKANLFESKESIATIGYKSYSSSEFYNAITKFFYYKYREGHEDRLSDDDYIAIANIRYPDRFDRCLTITVNCDLGDNITVKIDYTVVVRKGLNISQNDEGVSFEEITHLEDNNDIVVINTQNGYRLPKKFKDDRQITVDVAISNFIRKLNRNKWLSYCDRATNSWQGFVVNYLKSKLTPEFIESCIKRYLEDCKGLFVIPDDEHLIKSIRLYEQNNIFYGLKSIEEKARLIKECAKSSKILDEAEIILRMHSKPYQFIMSLSKDELGDVH